MIVRLKFLLQLLIVYILLWTNKEPDVVVTTLSIISPTERELIVKLIIYAPLLLLLLPLVALLLPKCVPKSHSHLLLPRPVVVLLIHRPLDVPPDYLPLVLQVRLLLVRPPLIPLLYLTLLFLLDLELLQTELLEGRVQQRGFMGVVSALGDREACTKG